MKIPSKSKLSIPIVSVAVLFLVAIVIVGSFVIKNRLVSAAPITDFKPGRIIDDSVFYNKDTMSAAQIQAFLDKNIPNCDIWGTGTSEYGGGTRAQYAKSRGWHNPPYVCLNKYHENPTTGENSYTKGGGAFSGGISAAQIIYNTAQKYGINPQVLLVLLKKESSGPLTNDNWPLKSQYTYAMGYGCPDSGPGNSANCSNAPKGLYKQMEQAGWQLKYYKDHLNDYRYKIGQNDIQYSPDPSCGTKRVNIENIATLSLYIYTPYTPNAGALANYPGTAHCGAYGNRNFFMFFKEWFGSTTNVTIPGCAQATNTSLSCAWKLKSSAASSDTITTSHSEATKLVNTGKYSYSGVDFFTRNKVAPKSGNIPVYRLDKPDGSSFLTTNKGEYDALASAWSGKGIEFYADPAGSNSGYTVSRLYNPNTGAHAWTGNGATRSSLLKQGYISEGTAFMSLSPTRQETAAPAGQSLVYRFGSMPGNTHFWTKSVTERDSMIKAGYRYEGVAWNASSAATTKPVYRLYSPTMRKHLFTTDANERRVLSATSSWKDEGIAFYAAPGATTKPVYRLYLKENSAHFFTTDANERRELVRTGVARDEGIAWYQP